MTETQLDEFISKKKTTNNSRLNYHQDDILKMINANLKIQDIHEDLQKFKNVEVTYEALRRYIKRNIKGEKQSSEKKISTPKPMPDLANTATSKSRIFTIGMKDYDIANIPEAERIISINKEKYDLNTVDLDSTMISETEKRLLKRNITDLCSKYRRSLWWKI